MSVEKLQGYLNVVDSIIEVYRQAQREREDGSGRRGNVMLMNCRERFGFRLKRIDRTHQTAWDMGFFYVVELLWEILHPISHASDAERIGRVEKAHDMACTLEKMLSAMIVMESTSPVDLKEALERFHGEFIFLFF